MILKELALIVAEHQKTGMSNPFIRNALKEYLQVNVLYSIYTSPVYKQNLIFTGGTCLRHFYGLERLSEDLDFDFIHDFDRKVLAADLAKAFEKKYKYTQLTAATKQQDNQILLKFPVLKQLGMARGGESDWLYVKVDVSPIPSKNYDTVTTAQNSYGLNYAVRHYDLPSLMSGKLHAILSRKYLKGTRDAIKGRDYFDLLWFVREGIHPNLKRLSDMLSRTVSLAQIEAEVDRKVSAFHKHHADFEADMVETDITHYQNDYLRYKARVFSQTVQLDVRCQNCGKVFSSGISINKDALEGLAMAANTHQCPFCGHNNRVNKESYLKNISN